MTSVLISDNQLIVDILGWHRLWACKRRIAVPMDNVAAIRTDSHAARQSPRGLRCPGTYLPGVITAGSYYTRQGWTFWDVRHPDRTVLIELRNAPYTTLVLEVADPAATVQAVAARLPAA